MASIYLNGIVMNQAGCMVRFRGLFLVVAVLICFALGGKEACAIVQGGGEFSPVLNNEAMPDFFSGAFSDSIPLDVPLGRNGMQPNMRLRYNSNKKNGWVGVGWGLDVGAVQRRVKPRGGLDYLADEYEFKSADGIVELVNSPGTQEYFAKIESDFTRFEKLDNAGEISWVATAKDGKKFYFGEDGNSQQSSSDGTKVFKWCLTRIEDPYGNRIDFTYSKDAGEIYLDTVAYADTIIKFYLASRTDTFKRFTPSFPVETSKRLVTIEIKSANYPVRAYRFEYDANKQAAGNQYSANTGRSLLTSVKLFGSDALVDPQTGNITNNPPNKEIALSYSSVANDFKSEAQWIYSTNPSFNALDRIDKYLADFNGDGRSDFMSKNNGWNVTLSNGTSFDPASQWLAPSGPSGSTVDSYYNFVADFNGDGMADFMYDNGGWYVALSNGGAFDPPEPWLDDVVPSGATNGAGVKYVDDFNGDGKMDYMYENGGWYVALSNGDGFDMPEQWLGSSGPSGSTTSSAYKAVGDFNGDGRVDYMYYNNGWYVSLSDGTRFETPTLWLSSSNNPGISPNTIRFAGDFNGDGKTDYMFKRNNILYNLGPWYVMLSKGDSFDMPSQWLSDVPGVGDEYRYHMSADFNGDGRSDYLYYKHWDTSLPIFNKNGWTVVLSNGNGFGPPARWSTAPSPAGGLPVTQQHIAVGDFNGDGKAGFLRVQSEYQLNVVESRGHSDLLVNIDDSLGSGTTISYASSSTYDNIQLPFPIQTVKSVTTDDGNGNLATTGYEYAGGYFHTGESDFRGFHYSKVTGPAGPNGEQEVSETWYHQGDVVTPIAESLDYPLNPNYLTADYKALDNTGPAAASEAYMMGRPYRTKATDQSGGLISVGEITYQADSAEPYFNPQSSVVAKTYDGDADYIETRTDYLYDEYGNLTQEQQYGNTGIATDDRTLNRIFAHNTSAWILDKPIEKTVYNSLSVVPESMVSKTTFYYDDPYDAAACTTPSGNQMPTKGNLTQLKRWLSPTVVGTEARIGFDTYGNPACNLDPEGNKSTVTYDPTGTFPLVKTNPKGHQTVTTYYGVDGVVADKGLYGQVKTVTDANGATITNEYDAFGRKAKETFSDGSWSSWAYNNFGTVGTQHVRTDNSTGLWSEDYFDGFGRTTKKRYRGEGGKVISRATVYDVWGKVRKLSFPYFEGDPRYDRVYTYDPAGRKTQVDLPDGTTRKTCYDDGRILRIDANGHAKQETIDAFGRLEKVEEFTGTTTSCDASGLALYATTQYSYDALDNLKAVTDTEGNITSMVYDWLGRKESMSDPDMGQWFYTYDANNNLQTQTDAKSQTITFVYDSLNRREKKIYPDGSEVNFTYDDPTHGFSKGHLTTMSDASGTTDYYFDDALARNTRLTKTVDGSSYTITTVKDALGRVQSITYPDDTTVGYTYHDSGNLWQAGGYATYTGYTAAGQPGTVTYQNGVSTTYQYYQQNNLLWSIDTQDSSQQGLINLEYDYDDKGSIGSITNYLDASRTQIFGYDELDRLTSAQSTAYGTLGYEYDEIGNFQVKEGITYTPDATRPHAVGSTSDGKLYAYDANGNMTADSQRTLVWDYDNRPSSITSGGTTTTFTYDGAGARVKKDGPGGTVTYIDKLYELSGGVPAKYIFANGQRIAIETQISTYYYHQDHLGSTGVVTDQNGSKAEDVFYKPFGETFFDSGSIEVNHKFTGQELDAETGLYFYNARYYNQSLGRFISADIFVPNPADPQSLNRYSYVLNNPLKYVDPSGHQPELNLELEAESNQSQSESISVDLTEAFHDFEKNVIRPIAKFFKSLFGGGDDREPNYKLMHVTQQQGSRTSLPAYPVYPGQMMPSHNPYKIIAESNARTAEGIMLPWTFEETVQTNGPWDYKNQFGPQWENFGNYNYGVAGAASGLFTLETLLIEAGRAQTGCPPPEWGTPSSGPPYGDDPKDQKWIRQGWNDYQSGMYGAPAQPSIFYGQPIQYWGGIYSRNR